MPLPRNPLPSLEILESLFEIRDCQLFWKHRPQAHFGNKSAWASFESNRAGKRVGVMNKNGYIVTSIDYRQVFVHRIVFKMTRGYEPFIVDHADGNRGNNDPSNLRAATQSQNFLNAKIQKNNRTGYKGVSPAWKAGLFQANITVDGKSHRLGYFKSPEEAHEAYYAEAQRLAGEFACRGK